MSFIFQEKMLIKRNFLIVFDQSLTSDKTFLMEKSPSNVQRHNHTGNYIVKYNGSKITILQNFRRNYNKYEMENDDRARYLLN